MNTNELLPIIQRKRRSLQTATMPTPADFVCPHCGRRASDPVAVEPLPAVPLVLADGHQVEPVEIPKPNQLRDDDTTY